jgi:anti-sigma-K factor RskA
MTGSLPPEHQEELMVGYVLGDLSPEEAEEFRQLLVNNPQLVQEVDRLQEVLDLLPYALPEIEPPPQLRSAILDAAAADINREPVRKRPRLPWSKILGSVAAVLALALGLDNYRLRQELKIAQTQKNVLTVLQQPHTRVVSLTGTDQAETASGSILVNLDEQKAVIVFQNLQIPPTNQIYRLWAIANNKPIACAEFSASQQGTVLDEFSLRARDPACSNTKSTLAVSLEPSSLPPQPVGPIVMKEASQLL